MSHLSIAVAVSLALSTAAAKAQTASTEEPKTLPKVSVAAPEPEETIKVERVSSPKFTQDLLDTPQCPAEPTQCDNLLFFLVVQDIAHTHGAYSVSRRNQCP